MADYLWTNDVERIIQDDYLDNEDWMRDTYEIYLNWCQDIEEEPLDFEDWKYSEYLQQDLNEVYYQDAEDWSETDLRQTWLPMIFDQDLGHGIIGIDMWSRYEPYIVFLSEEDMEDWISNRLRLLSPKYSTIEEGKNNQLWLNRYRLYTFPESTRQMYKFIKRYTCLLDGNVQDAIEPYTDEYNEDSTKEFYVKQYFEFLDFDDSEPYFITADPKDVIESGLLVPIENK